MLLPVILANTDAVHVSTETYRAEQTVSTIEFVVKVQVNTRPIPAAPVSSFQRNRQLV